MASPIKKKFIRVPHVHLSNIFREIGRNPHVDWGVTLLVSTLVAVALVGWGVRLYVQIKQGKVGGDPALKATAAQNFNRAVLQSTVDKFNIKIQATEDAKKGYTGPSDPSL